MELNVGLAGAAKANLIHLLPDCSGSMSIPVSDKDLHSESRSDALKRGIVACIDACKVIPSLKTSLLVALTTICEPTSALLQLFRVDGDNGGFNGGVVSMDGQWLKTSQTTHTNNRTNYVKKA